MVVLPLATVTLYGPRGAERVLGAALALGIERSRFPVEIVEVKTGDRIGRDGYDMVAFETDHRADTIGWAMVEHQRLGRFDPERARQMGIPEGPLWGRIHKGQAVTLETQARAALKRGDAGKRPGGDTGGACGADAGGAHGGLLGRHPAVRGRR